MSWVVYLVGSFILFATTLHAKDQAGWIGVTVGTVTPELAISFELDKPEGVLVYNVDDNGPAIKAGIQRGDIITHLQGDPVTSTLDLSSRIARLPPGSAAEIRVRTIRGYGLSATTAIQEFVVTVQEYPYGGRTRKMPTDPFTAGWRTTLAWAADGDTLCRTYNRLVTQCVDQMCSELAISSRREIAVMMAEEVRPGVSNYAREERKWLVDEIMGKCPLVQSAGND